MIVVDSFIFYNELDLLLYRFSILNDYVDKFILVEATHTFSGEKKPLFFSENKDMFKKFQDKIIHVIVDDFPHKTYQSTGKQWDNEAFQRNCIKRGIDLLKLESTDVIFTSDLDEIVDPILVKKLRDGGLDFDKYNLNRFELDMYYYNLNCKLPGKWHGVKLLTYETYIRTGFTFEQMRTWEWSHPVPIIKMGGWHLSYFGDAKTIQNKIKTFSHQELNLEKYTNLETIQQNIINQRDIFNRTDCEIIKISVKDNTFLPPQWETFLTKYVTY